LNSPVPRTPAQPAARERPPPPLENNRGLNKAFFFLRFPVPLFGPSCQPETENRNPRPAKKLWGNAPRAWFFSGRPCFFWKKNHSLAITTILWGSPGNAPPVPPTILSPFSLPRSAPGPPRPFEQKVKVFWRPPNKKLVPVGPVDGSRSEPNFGLRPISSRHGENLPNVPFWARPLFLLPGGPAQRNVGGPTPPSWKKKVEAPVIAPGPPPLPSTQTIPCRPVGKPVLPPQEENKTDPANPSSERNCTGNAFWRKMNLGAAVPVGGQIPGLRQ